MHGDMNNVTTRLEERVERFEDGCIGSHVLFQDNSLVAACPASFSLVETDETFIAVATFSYAMEKFPHWKLALNLPEQNPKFGIVSAVPSAAIGRSE